MIAHYYANNYKESIQKIFDFFEKKLQTVITEYGSKNNSIINELIKKCKEYIKMNSERDRNNLKILFDNIQNIEFLRGETPRYKKTPEEIKILNDEFKSKLEIFKTKYGSQEDYKVLIKEFEDKIKEAENKKLTLKLFNEPTKFDEEIITKNLSDISGIITNILMFKNDEKNATLVNILMNDNSNKEIYIFTALLLYCII
jgi:hypothetical protein